VKDTPKRNKLHQSNILYSTLVEKSNDGIIIIQDERLIYANPKMTALTGFSLEEITGKPFVDFISPEYRPMVLERYQRRLAGENVTNQYEIEIVSKDNRKIPVEINASYIEYEDKPANMAILRDLTEYKMSQLKLAENEARCHELFKNSYDAILLTIPNGRILAANPAACGMFGRTETEIREIGRDGLIDVTDPRLQQALEIRAATGEFKGELTFLRSDGTTFPGEITSKIYPVGKGELRTAMIIRDVSKRKEAEEKLRAAEEHYRLTLDNMLEGCQIIGRDWRYIYLNTMAVRHSRKPKEALIGRTMMEAYPGIGNTELFIHLRRCMENRTAIRIENRFIFPDTTEGWFELSIEPVPEGIFILSLDITRRKETEKQLQISEERFHRIFDQVPIGIAITDQYFKFTQVNKTMCRMMGYSGKELTAITFKEITHPKYLAYDLKQLKLLSAGVIDNFERDKQYIRKDGSVFWGHISVGAIKDDKGKILYYTPCILDITKRKQTEQALRKYKLIADDSRDIILFLDKNSGQILETNAAATKAYGYTRRQLLNKTVYEIRPPETRAAIPMQLAQADSEGILFESYHMRKNGSIFPVEVSSRGATINNTRVVVSVIRDISERKKAEEKFKTIFKHQETILATVPDIIAEVDTNKVYTWINESGLEFFGDDVIGKEASHYFIGKQDTYQKIRPVFSGGENTVYVESWQRRKDGEPRLLGWWAHSLKDITGKTVGALSVTSDITDRKRMEENLVKSAAEWSTTFDSINDMICIVDAGYMILRVNNAFAKSLKLPPEEIIGKHCYELIHETDQPHFMCPHKKTLETGRSQVSEFFEENLNTWVEATTSPVLDADNRVVGSVHVIKNINERKKSEEALRAERETYMSLFNSVTDAIIVHRPKSDKTPDKILEVNDACAAMLEYSRDELQNMTVRDFVKGMAEDTTSFSNIIEQIEKNKEATFERTFVTKTGREIPVEIRPRIFLFGGKPTVISMARDISDLKKIEAERQKLRERADMANRLAAVGEMAAGIAHEINNPLTGVVGFAELLSNRPDLPADVQDSLKVINNGSLRVVEIVKRLLTFARQTKPIISKVSITDIIDNSLTLRSYVLETAGITIIRDYAPDLPWINVDPAQIQQVFLNLILNAEHSMKKAHEKGTLSIKTEKAGEYIRISFKDDGTGIAADVMDKIFQPFFTTKDPGQGTGLGLSLSQGIILEHNGRIWAENNPEGGATFVIELPVSTTCEIPSQPSEKSAPAYSAPKRSASAMVIDDEPAVRSLLKIILTQDGHQVEECENPEKALDKLREHTYDIIFLDIRMPGMSGTELYDKIISNWPGLAGRIVFITGDTSDAKVREYLDNHDIPYVTKPFDMSLLKTAMHRVLSKIDADN
jgi:PAS domain S-box-containing protein